MTMPHNETSAGDKRMTNEKVNPSLNPQRMRDGSWYYENDRSIDVYFDASPCRT